MAGSWRRRSLRHRMVLLVSLGMLATLGTLGAVAAWSARLGVDRMLEERLLLARVVADRLDSALNGTLARLSSDWEAVRGLHRNSLLSGQVFLLDAEGRVVQAEPPGRPGDPAVRRALDEVRPTVSDRHTVDAWGRRVVTLAVPLKDGSGRLVGVAGGQVDLALHDLEALIASVRVGETGYTDVVDATGMVLASTRRERVLGSAEHRHFLAGVIRERRPGVGTCHDCHARSPRREVVAFAPLTAADWAVVVRQDEAEALAPSREMQWLFLGFGAFLVVVALAMAWGAAHSVVRPIERLTAAARTIAAGNLDDPIPQLGEDEVGRLGRAFDAMRLQLQEWTRTLEDRVRERTRLLEESESRRLELLRKVISAQEEERRRVARDLHDTTSQEITAVVMALPDGPARDLAVRALEGVHRIMVDLRPAVLDDLGLASALRWYAAARLEPLGVEVAVEIGGRERRLSAEVETALFRVVQEAVNNVARHAQAEVVVLSVEFGERSVTVELEDDGQGFDPTETFTGPRGLGLMGMRERVGLLGGMLTLESGPRKGTRITVEVPTDDSDPDRG